MRIEKVIAITVAAALLSAAGIILTHGENDRDLTWNFMESYDSGAAKVLSGYNKCKSETLWRG